MAQQESDIKVRAGNIASALKHGPTRLIFIGGIVLSLVVVVLAFSFMGGGKPANNGEVVLESVPEPTVAPSGQTLTNTKAYDALAQQSDIQALKQAQQTGGTAMPMPRPGQAAAEAKGEVTIDGTGVNMNAVPEPAAAATTTAQAQSAEATARLQQHEQQVQARYATMSKQYDNLVGRWISVQTPVSVAVNQERKAGEAADAQVGSAAVASTASDEMAETTSSAVLRANDTYLGITLGDATTDDRLPLVRARILNGPGKGSVMRGTIETSEFAPGGFIHFTRAC
ncbi:hypothetical protein [Xanthomonas cissicola]|uniref:Uncharacterized protein n=2 Tax=Xanthomonas cissicola TaxID=86186 RepID=A0ABX3M1X8_9XANT|nr:hypothetical protein [Xanthomonas cissicola]OOW68889.1 hypothetical protein Xant_20435 [Xanthomonas cissicola]